MLIFLLLCKIAVTVKFSVTLAATAKVFHYFCCYSVRFTLLLLLLCKGSVTVAVLVKNTVAVPVTVKFAVTFAVNI